jgi:MFS family permease
VRRRIGPGPLIRACVAASIAGLLLVLTSPPWLAVVGLGALGIGLALLGPIMVSAVTDSSSVGHYTTLSHGGVLAGPVVIGWLAGPLGLTAALAALILPLAGIALFAAAPFDRTDKALEGWPT